MSGPFRWQVGDAGIKAITSLIESAKGVAQAALASGSTTDREPSSDLDTLRTQITELASDPATGTNFLTSGSQTASSARDRCFNSISTADATAPALILRK
jgi:hypothetical protein